MRQTLALLAVLAACSGTSAGGVPDATCPQGYTCTVTMLDGGAVASDDVIARDVQAQPVDVPVSDAGAPMDALGDVPMDTGVDVGVDTGGDVAGDAGTDVPPPCTVDNCGGVACVPGPHVATMMCARDAHAGCACAVATCEPGYADCNHYAEDGCEADTNDDPANCGACVNVCNLPHTAINACVSGSCVVVTCAPYFSNCDGIESNGCEMDTTSSVSNCGACGLACNLPNATSECHVSVCLLTACNAGYCDYDHRPGNGCEARCS